MLMFGVAGNVNIVQEKPSLCHRGYSPSASKYLGGPLQTKGHEKKSHSPKEVMTIVLVMCVNAIGI